MSVIMAKIIDTYNYFIHDLADPRTENWWGVSNPFLILFILSSYLYFCISLGPRLMKNRSPYELKSVILVYDVSQILLNLFIIYEGAIYITSEEFNLTCGLVDYSTKPRAMRTAAGTWWYFATKISELLDTVFFVLRKKNKQITFLHVDHHTVMLFSSWITIKYFPGGHHMMIGFLNAIVHVIMYTYYLISGLGPEYQKYLWWKKHVTLIQMIQFCFRFIHNISTFLYKCGYSKIISFLLCSHSLLFIYMFGKFYVDNYKGKTKNKQKTDSKNGNAISKNVDDTLQNFKDKAF